MDAYIVEFTTKAGNNGRIKLPNPARLGTFVYHAVRLGDTITKIEKVS